LRESLVLAPAGAGAGAIAMVAAQIGGIMETGSIWILCVADSSTRLNYIARAIKKAGYNVSTASSGHKAVAMTAIRNNIEAVLLDEDMIVTEDSIAESIKAVKPLPILLVCDAGPTGALPPGVDLVTANGSRQQILAGLVKLLKGTKSESASTGLK
jgi:CheY-like chemotaxis protein